MSKRIEYLLENISAQIGVRESDDIAASIALRERKPSSAQEGKQMKAILDVIVEKYGEDMARKTMRPCGYHCISDAVIQKARDIHKDTASLQSFLDELNQNHIGGGHLRIVDNLIIGEYDHCYCGTAKHTKGMSPVYCECSAGWFERLFSSVFEKPVVVVPKHTILQGEATCIFEISNFEAIR